MPFSYSELSAHGLNAESVEKLIFQGFYPRLYDKEIEAKDFYPNYIQTYIERDVRLLHSVQNLNLFIRFMKLCAGRTGQLLNLSSLANDTGLASLLLGISSARQIDTHFHFGALFEDFVISELLKRRFHKGNCNILYFWRDHKCSEIDVIIDHGDSLIPLEIKSSRTFSESFFPV